MANFNTAHAEWANRPDDERFLTLESLLAHTTARREISRSVNLPLNSLKLANDGDGDLYVAGHNGHPVHFTNWSFGQLCSQVKAPASYLRALPAPIAKLNLEYGMEMTDAGRDLTQFYFSPPQFGPDGALAQPGIGRSFNGTKYGRIYDAQVVQAVMDLNDREGGRWTVPLDAYKGVNSKTATTLYGSDRDCFVFLVDQSRPIEVDGQTLFRGFYAWNSEVGKNVFGIATFLFSYVCQNRMIWGGKNFEELRIRHTSLAPDRFLEEARPVLHALSESSAEPIIATIKAAKATRIGKTVDDVEKWLAGKGFGKVESKLAVTLAAQGGDTGSSGDFTNLYDIVQGGTASARGIPHADARVESERAWSSLLKYAGVDLGVLDGHELAALPSAN